jgi:2-polyprenyl-3-methyl-5-hydroxy-6-metoxy-1,4-benzoquinol methylase
MENIPAESALRPSMHRRLLRRAIVNGQITVPAVPGMVDEYVTMCDDVFKTLGVQFNAEELAHMRGVLERQLNEAYAASPRSDIVINYEIPTGLTANYRVAARWFTVGQAYDNWVATREPPLFGTEPDARVVAVAADAGKPAAAPVLDVGAGTGRNSLALARRGHPVDAVEMTEKFAEIITAEAQKEKLKVRVIRRDVFDKLDDLRTDYRLILLSEVVSDFRNTDQLRQLFELAAHCLAPGGELLFNIFLPRGEYIPDAAARELGQQCYTTIFTRDELAAAGSGLPLDLVADDSVFDYEKGHLPAESWPPTSWYANWVNGQDVFDVPIEASPIEMRWLVYRKAG